MEDHPSLTHMKRSSRSSGISSRLRRHHIFRYGFHYKRRSRRQGPLWYDISSEVESHKSDGGTVSLDRPARSMTRNGRLNREKAHFRYE
jgi:hypothetical protein